jgi:hypothetical protein
MPVEEFRIAGSNFPSAAAARLDAGFPLLETGPGLAFFIPQGKTLFLPFKLAIGGR